MIEKSNNMTLASDEITILKLVAKPFKMLSEYLMTIAVINPPNTWIRTVHHAQNPKFLKSAERENIDVVEKMTGARAGRRENMDNWTFRTHRSAFEPLRTISKYTPARPDVKHANETAINPTKGFIAEVL